MGIHDRDYIRDGRGRGGTAFGGMRMWTVTTWLIVINVAVFLLDSVLSVNLTDAYGRRGAAPLLTYFGHFSVGTAIYQLQVWRFITFQFLHAGLYHLLFNMIGLYFFGPMIEQLLGWRRYLAFYLLCGMAGPVGYMALLWGSPMIGGPWVPLVGASAGLFGILIAAARIAPDATVLIYGIIPMRLRVMAWLLLGVAVWTVFTAGRNAGGEAAHLGGAALGFLLIRNPHWLNFVNPRRRLRYRG